MLEYFDVFQIGLTATPDNRTFGYFNQNVVSEYTHQQAVTDGVNVGFNIYTIETEITQQGGRLKMGEDVDRREKLSRKKRWLQLDEDTNYTDTINPDKLVKAGWDADNQGKANTLINDFKAWIAAHRDEINALQIFYNQPQRRRELTYAMIRQLLEALKADKLLLAPLSVWRADEQLEQTNCPTRTNWPKRSSKTWKPDLRALRQS